LYTRAIQKIQSNYTTPSTWGDPRKKQHARVKKRLTSLPTIWRGSMHVEIPEKPDVERLEDIQLLKKPKKEKKTYSLSALCVRTKLSKVKAKRQSFTRVAQAIAIAITIDIVPWSNYITQSTRFSKTSTCTLNSTADPVEALFIRVKRI